MSANIPWGLLPKLRISGQVVDSSFFMDMDMVRESEAELKRARGQGIPVVLMQPRDIQMTLREVKIGLVSSRYLGYFLSVQLITIVFFLRVLLRQVNCIVILLSSSIKICPVVYIMWV